MSPRRNVYGKNTDVSEKKKLDKAISALHIDNGNALTKNYKAIANLGSV
jgi:hypothetical protein